MSAGNKKKPRRFLSVSNVTRSFFIGSMAQRFKRPRSEAATESVPPLKRSKVKREADSDPDYDSDVVGDLSQLQTQDEKDSGLSSVVCHKQTA